MKAVVPVALALALHGVILVGLARMKSPPFNPPSLLRMALPLVEIATIRRSREMPAALPPAEPAKHKVVISHAAPAVTEAIATESADVELPPSPAADVDVAARPSPLQTGSGPPEGRPATAPQVGNAGSRAPSRDLVADALARINAQRRYPELARRRGVEGRVRVRFVVDAQGRVSDVRIVRSADELLNDAAREAVERAAPLPPIGDAEVDLDFHLD